MRAVCEVYIVDADETIVGAGAKVWKRAGDSVVGRRQGTKDPRRAVWGVSQRRGRYRCEAWAKGRVSQIVLGNG